MNRRTNEPFCQNQLLSGPVSKSLPRTILTDIVNVSLLKLDLVFILVLILLTAARTLVDREVALELAVRLEIARLVRCVPVDNVGAVVLEITEGEEDNVAGCDPDLAAQHKLTGTAAPAESKEGDVRGMFTRRKDAGNERRTFFRI